MVLVLMSVVVLSVAGVSGGVTVGVVLDVVPGEGSTGATGEGGAAAAAADIPLD